MSLLDLFTSGKHKRARTYFAALVKLAFADGSMDKKELKYLKKMSVQLGMSDHEFVKIIEYPDRYPIAPSLAYDDRIEKLYYLTHMIFSDSEVKLDEAKLIRRLAIGLGFPVANVEKITDEAIHLVMNNNNLDDFTKAVKVVNS